MKYPVHISTRAAAVWVMVGAIVLAIVLLKARSGAAQTNTPHSSSSLTSSSASTVSHAKATVDLLPSQLEAIRIEPVGTYCFPVEKEAVGNIDFDEDLSVQVFSPYPGKIITALAKLGDEVQKGQALYTIDSPDLIQAESNLISTAATLSLTEKELARAKDLSSTKGISEREVEQAASDQQAAEGAFKAARNAVRVFGKTEAEIDQIVASRKIDPALVVPSPVTGRVTSRNAQPGLLVQPGNAPPPYSVADLSTKWMVANVIESDSPFFRVGQPVRAQVLAYSGPVFEGRISRMGAAVDPNTHRVMVRCDIADPKEELRPGMLASFVIAVQDPVVATAMPANGVVREGDGTMSVWVTMDRRRFSHRRVKIGLQRDGRYQVLDGLQPGELAVTDEAIFLSYMLEAPPAG
jgi:membrane fusion protein, heavy metal efflux system